MAHKHCLLISVMLLSLLFLSCNGETTIPQLDNSNRGVINYLDFALDTDSINLNTDITGTIYIKTRDDLNDIPFIEIVSWINIDSRDWAGVEFGIPKELYVTSVSTSYPRGDPKPEEYAIVWYNNYYYENPEQGNHIWIQIGESKGSDRVRGGQGSIIIELDFLGKQIPDSVDILVGAGSQGETTAYPCYEILQIPVNSDYRIK